MHVADRVLLQVTAKACEAMLNEWFDHYDVQPCDGYLTEDETNRALRDWIAKVIFPLHNTSFPLLIASAPPNDHHFLNHPIDHPARTFDMKSLGFYHIEDDG